MRFRTSTEGEVKCESLDCISSEARLYREYIQRRGRECHQPNAKPAQTQGKRVAAEFGDSAE